MNERIRVQIRKFIPSKDRSEFEALVTECDALAAKMVKAKNPAVGYKAAYDWRTRLEFLKREERTLLAAAIAGCDILLAEGERDIAKVRAEHAKIRKQREDRQLTREEFFEKIKPTAEKLKVYRSRGSFRYAKNGGEHRGKPGVHYALLVDKAQLGLSLRGLGKVKVDPVDQANIEFAERYQTKLAI